MRAEKIEDNSGEEDLSAGDLGEPFTATANAEEAEEWLLHCDFEGYFAAPLARGG